MNLLKAVNNNLLIKEDKQTKTASGLDLPPKEGDTAKGTVVDSASPDFHPGQVIWYRNWNAVEVSTDEGKFHVVEAKDIKLVLQDSQIPAGPRE